MWRYRWYAMVLAWLIAIIGWAVVAKMPDIYTATARVHVDTQSILRPLMRGLTVEPNVTQRLNLMTRTLLSRPNMEKLARMTDLDIHATTPAQMNTLLNSLAGKIKLDSPGRDENIYTFSYTSDKPIEAKNIVQNLLNILSESTLGENRENTDTAQRFLKQQITQYEKRLEDAENNLKEFKQKNRALMPTLSQGYFQSLQATEKSLEEARLELAEAQRGRDELRRQLTGEEPVFGIASDSTITPILSSASDVRIQELEKQRDELLLQYTEQHPKVVSIQETIDALKKKKVDEANENKNISKPITPVETNPVYQQIRVALAQAEAKVSVLQVRTHEYQNKVIKLKSMVNQIPEVENELRRLEHQYELARTKYNEFVEREETAKLSEKVEEIGDGVRIKVIDPPFVPTTPTGPNRFMFYSAVLAGALGAALGLAFVMSQLKPVVHDVRTLRRLSGLPVYGSVSRMWTPEMLKKKKMEYGGYITVGLLLLLSYATTLKMLS